MSLQPIKIKDWNLKKSEKIKPVHLTDFANIMMKFTLQKLKMKNIRIHLNKIFGMLIERGH